MKYVVAMAVLPRPQVRHGVTAGYFLLPEPRRLAPPPWPSPSPDAVLATIYAAVKPGEG